MSRNRASDGRYDFENPDLMCECNHKLGIHAAKNDTGKRPCFNEDVHGGGTGEPCDCTNFKKAKKRRSK